MKYVDRLDILEELDPMLGVVNCRCCGEPLIGERTVVKLEGRGQPLPTGWNTVYGRSGGKPYCKPCFMRCFVPKAATVRKLRTHKKARAANYG